MVRPINSKIGVSFKYGIKYESGKIHKGVDFSDGHEGHDVFSCLDGKVSYVGNGGGWGRAYGQHVIIKSRFNGKTRWMLYGHLKTENVKMGQAISAGQKIGTSGGRKGARYSGNSTGAHVHVQAGHANNYLAYESPWPMINHNAKPVVADWDKPETFVLGATGPDVIRLGRRLEVWAKALGLPKPYMVGPSSPFSTTDKAAVKAFQKAQKWTGAGADGYPGSKTLALLAKDPKPAEKVSATLVAWNVKSPALNGPWPKWTERRDGQIGLIDLAQPSVLLGQEFGSLARIAWYDSQLDHLGLTNVRAYKTDGPRIKSGTWPVIYYDTDVFTTVTSSLYPIRATLNGNAKQMAECVLARGGNNYFFGSIQLEEEDGTDLATRKSAGQIRLDQIADCFRRMGEAAKTHHIRPEHRFIGGDTYSASEVKDWVETNTDHRDSAGVATVPQHEGISSANEWKPLSKGAREDCLFVHKGLAIDTFDQVDGHEVSDHNPQITTFAI